MKRIRNFTAAVFLLAAGMVSVSAHSIYVAERHGELEIVFGYSAVDQAYSPHSINVVSAFTADGKPAGVQKIDNGTYVTLKPDPGVVGIGTTMDYGFFATAIARGDSGWKKGKKSSVPGAVRGLHAIKYNLAILADPDVAPKPRGVGIEIIPLEAQLKKARGDQLPVQVFLDGKPLEGVELREDFVNNDTLLTRKTDATGKTVVTLHNDRLNVIGLEYDEPVTSDPDVDFNRYATTLSFALPHAEP